MFNRLVVIPVALLMGAPALMGQDYLSEGHTGDSTSSSPFAAPKSSDTVFVVERGADLDSGCTYKSGSPLEFDVPVTRFFGDESARQKLEAHGLLPHSIYLQLPAYDVDFDAVVSGIAPERDEVYFNDHLVTEQYLTGTNNTWKLNAFQIPIEWVEFPDEGSLGGGVTPAMNRIRIEIDTANLGDSWCTSIDWASLTIPAPLPVVMVHGILSNGGTWGAWVAQLDALGVLNSNALNMGALDSIQSNALKIAGEVDKAVQKWGVNQVVLVCHSKGGLDSRHFAENNPHISQVIQIGTPNGGSPLADLVQEGLVEYTGPFGFLIGALAAPAGYQLTTTYMSLYNLTHGNNAKAAYTALAGKFDPNCFFSFKCFGYQALLFITGPGDTIVPVWSVHTLPYTANFTYQSVGISDTSATHTELNKSQAVIQILQGIATKVPANDSAPDSADGSDDTAPHTAVLTGTLSAGGVEMLSIPIDATSDVKFVILLPPAVVPTALVAPGGAVFTSSTPPANPGVAYGESEVFGLVVRTYAMAGLKTGTWTVRLDGTQLPAGQSLPFVVTASVADSAIEFTAELQPASVHHGDSFVAMAVLANGGSPVSGATVVVNSVSPGGVRGSTTLGPVPGQPGHYAGPVTVANEAGSYRFAAAASGSIPTLFSREMLMLGTSSVSAAQIVGVQSEAGIDTNGNGLFDELQIGLGLNIDVGQAYKLFAELVDSQGNILTAAKDVLLSPGPQTVIVSFDGHTLYANGVSGPYQLKHVVLFEEVGPDVLVVDELANNYQTAPYQSSSFEHEKLTVPGTGFDVGIDTNANGLFDVLQVSLDVLADVPGFYNYSARLVDKYGTEIGFKGGTSFLSSGLNVLTFAFDGNLIGANAISGPYYLRDVLITGSSTAAVFADIVYATIFYNAAAFEGFNLVCGTSPAWSNYGDGWPGTHGVPRLDLEGTPNLCEQVELVVGNSSWTSQPVTLFMGFSETALLTPFGGTLLVVPAAQAQFTLTANRFEKLPLRIPCSADACGLEIFAQTIQVDPGAPGGYAFSKGLHVTLGLQ